MGHLPENVMYRAFRARADDMDEYTISHHHTSDGAKAACQSLFDEQREEMWPELDPELVWDSDEDTGSIFTPQVNYAAFWVEQVEVLP